MTVFGIAPIDDALGPIEEARAYLLHGTDADALRLLALSFSVADTHPQMRSAFLSDMDGAGLQELAGTLGFDVRQRVNDGRLIPLRFQPFAGEKIVSLGGPGRTIYELKNFFSTPFPERMAVLPARAFMSFNSPDELTESIVYLNEAMARIQTSVLLTHVNSGSEQDLHILNQLKRSAHGVFQLEIDLEGSRYLRVEKGWRTQHKGARFFLSIQPGKSLTAVAQHTASRSEPRDDGKASVLAFAPDEEMRAAVEDALSDTHHLQVVEKEDAAAHIALSSRVDLIVACHGDKEKLASFVKYLRMQDVTAPLVACTGEVKRASERSDLITYGADAVLFKPLHPGDLDGQVSMLLTRHRVRPSYYHNQEFIRIRERIAALLDDGIERAPDTGMLSPPSFMSLGNLMLTEARLLSRRKLLLGFKIEGVTGYPPLRLSAAFRDKLRKEDPVALLPSGTFLVLVDPSGASTAAYLARKLEGGLKEKLNKGYKLQVAEVTYPSDGDTVEALIEKLGQQLTG
jgi:DNA-binding response OmpR family regulator